MSALSHRVLVLEPGWNSPNTTEPSVSLLVSMVPPGNVFTVTAYLHHERAMERLPTWLFGL